MSDRNSRTRKLVAVRRPNCTLLKKFVALIVVFIVLFLLLAIPTGFHIYHNEHRYNFISIMAVGYLGLFTFYIFVLTVFIKKVLLSPIHRLIQAIQSVGRANFDTRVEIKARDELGTLGNLFNKMVEELRVKTVGKAYLDQIIATVPNFLLVLNASGIITETNAASLNALGYKRHELIGMPICSVVKLKDNDDSSIKKLVCTSAINTKEMDLCCKNSELTPVLFSATQIKNAKNELESIVCTAQDISERKEIEAKLEEFAHHDPLTGLPNRRHFEEIIQKVLAAASLHNKSFAVLMLDLNNFKYINDTYSHQAGDRLLQYVAQRIISQLRKDDYIARWGGDEFALIISDIENEEYVRTVASRIIESIAQPISIDNTILQTNASIGIACYPNSAKDVADLLEHADAAMYRAKKQGRGVACGVLRD